MVSPERLQRIIIKALHTKGQPVDTGIRKPPESRSVIRIGFQADLGIALETEKTVRRLHDPSDLLRLQQGRRATTKMKRGEFAAW